MNTHGHHNVSDEAGLPVLAEAFNRPEGRLASFYLGNWLTDLSQVIDPVAGITARNKIRKFLNNCFSFIDQLYTPTENEPVLKTIARFITPEALHTLLLNNIQALENDVFQFFNWFITAPPGQKSPWYKAAEPGVKLMGYFKFVHPEEPGDPPRMDLDVYLKVFKEQFTQYFPHEHMDRPAPNPPVDVPDGVDLDPYDNRQSTGPTTGTRSQLPDLYTYLREDIQVVAGRLTDLDIKWASKYLTKTEPFSDTDLEWNLGLAKFGQALHNVEDFFAHSNFIEHASRVMGETYFPESWGYDSCRYLKRLKKYSFPSVPDDWREAGDEDFVVSGYFDFRDTLVSLCHVAEDMLLGLKDIHPKDSIKELNALHDFMNDKDPLEKKIVDRADKVMHDFLEVLLKPSMILEEDSENSVAGVIYGFLNEVDGTVTAEEIDDFVKAVQHETPNVTYIAPLLESMPVFQEIKQLCPEFIEPDDMAKYLEELYEAFLTYSRWMTIRQGQTGTAISLFKVLKNILIFFGLPVRTLKKLIGKRLTDYGVYFAKEALYDVLAMDRIGCHSLIAKDHGAEFLYKQMRDCAKATHYYVVKTMMRWKLPGYKDRPESQKWVNWLELLEYFLCNPTMNAVCPVPKQVPVPIIHKLDEQDTQFSIEELWQKLYERFKPDSLDVDGLTFSAKAIFDWNMLTRVKKSSTKTATETWFPEMGRIAQLSYDELNRFVIPFQKHNLAVCNPATVGERWFIPVILTGWNPGINLRHTVTYHSSQSDAQAMVTSGEKLLQALISLYRPSS